MTELWDLSLFQPGTLEVSWALVWVSANIVYIFVSNVSLCGCLEVGVSAHEIGGVVSVLSRAIHKMTVVWHQR